MNTKLTTDEHGLTQINFLEKLLDGAEIEILPLGTIINTVTAPAKLKKESYRDALRAERHRRLSEVTA